MSNRERWNEEARRIIERDEDLEEPPSRDEEPDRYHSSGYSVFLELEAEYEGDVADE